MPDRQGTCPGLHHAPTGCITIQITRPETQKAGGEACQGAGLRSTGLGPHPPPPAPSGRVRWVRPMPYNTRQQADLLVVLEELPGVSADEDQVVRPWLGGLL